MERLADQDRGEVDPVARAGEPEVEHEHKAGKQDAMLIVLRDEIAERDRALQQTIEEQDRLPLIREQRRVIETKREPQRIGGREHAGEDDQRREAAGTIRLARAICLDSMFPALFRSVRFRGRAAVPGAGWVVIRQASRMRDSAQQAIYWEVMQGKSP